MNCRQGDLAYITCEPYIGHFVSVLRWTPPGNFTLPDGYPALNVDVGGWLCEKHVGYFDAPCGNDKRRQTRYAVIVDKYLRPIRDQPGEDEILRIAGLPKELERA